MTIHVRPLRNEEGNRQSSIARKTNDTITLRRAQTVLHSAHGFSPLRIAAMLGQAKVDVSASETLCELERLNAVEFVVGGDEIAVTRKLTAVDGQLKTLAQVFSFASDEGYLGISSGIRKGSL